MILYIQETPYREYLAVTVDLVIILDSNCRLRTLEMSFRGHQDFKGLWTSIDLKRAL